MNARLNTSVANGVQVRKVLALLVALLVSCLVLAGCAGSQQTQEQTQEEDPLQGHEAITLAIDTSPQLAGPLMELAQTYAVENPWITVDVRSVVNATHYFDKKTWETLGDLVITDSSTVLGGLEKDKLLDSSTEFTLADDSLVVVTAQDSKIEAVSQKKLASGIYSVAVAPEGTGTGTATRQALAELKLYSETSGQDGSFVGAYKKSGVVQLADTSAKLFSLVSDGQADIGIVKASDVYRYGGVKVVSSLEKGSYNSIRYTAAYLSSQDPATLAQVNDESKASDSGGESADSESADSESQSTDGEAADGTSESETAASSRVTHRDEMQAFVNWALSDEDAIQIWKKWNISLAL